MFFFELCDPGPIRRRPDQKKKKPKRRAVATAVKVQVRKRSVRVLVAGLEQAHQAGGAKLPARPVRRLAVPVDEGEGIIIGDSWSPSGLAAGAGGAGGGSPKRRTCSMCRQPGHRAPACPVVASGSSPTVEVEKAEVRRGPEPPRVALIRARALEHKRRLQERAELDAEISRLARALPPERDADQVEEAAAAPVRPFVEAAAAPPAASLPRWKRQGKRKRLPTESLIKLSRLVRLPRTLGERRQLAVDLALREAIPRPKSWGDCRPAGVYYVNGIADRADVDGPLRWWGDAACPWAGCKWNLGATVNETGSITFLDGLDDGLPTCVLELAGRGALTLEQVGELDGITRERTRQIETRALKAGARAPVLGLNDDD